MTRCLFCEIVAGNASCDEVYSDEEILAFHDINPQAPIHVLVIPRHHISSLADLSENDNAIMGRLAIKAAHLAATLGLAVDGYRLVLNCGQDAGQTVPHIHLHLLGGRPLGWPPG